MYAHGDNYGHGFVKKIVIDPEGNELLPLIFPAQIALAEGRSAGAIATAEMVEAGGRHWWVGEDAGSLGSPRVLLSQERLTDPVFIPVLATFAWQCMGLPAEAKGGYCVTGLPGSWSEDEELSRALNDRLRSALPGHYQKILVIAEQEALVYAILLDNAGNLIGDPRYREGRGLAADLGYHTDDVGKLDRVRRVRGSFRTYQTGTARALAQVRDHLSRRFDRKFSIHETDEAVREGFVKTAGGGRAPLPAHWDRPMVENADEFVNDLKVDYGKGGDLDYLILGGGGALQEIKVDRIRAAFPIVEVAPDPQLSIARGYARLGVLRSKKLQAQV